ncbi:uncharacterized protein LAESUDRAFT_257880 [Laetiporus sulphureus 93-53]|uniref:Uncharacterized protein n=1 Tax=Laetiporus sulphureus 93-53 TaxID=1314785 RepID=A0A165H3T1_9APHY|nr:uncharacterized protein LAESUDRAFT_257880 [Laetiporus sulphureus 93-53]KZT11204.1 hypothetical protein LAESUDRAFT_257880 [Laetiporus sulphureus 93-53]
MHSKAVRRRQQFYFYTFLHLLQTRYQHNIIRESVTAQRHADEVHRGGYTNTWYTTASYQFP